MNSGLMNYIANIVRLFAVERVQNASKPRLGRVRSRSEL